jgi:hypothetical protein
MSENTMLVGGKRMDPKRHFVRFAIDHIAIKVPVQDAAYRRVTDAIDKALKPHVADRGYDWEYHIDETERRLWKINGLIPPPHESEDEKIWCRENKAVPLEKL